MDFLSPSLPHPQWPVNVKCYMIPEGVYTDITFMFYEDVLLLLNADEPSVAIISRICLQSHFQRSKRILQLRSLRQNRHFQAVKCYVTSTSFSWLQVMCSMAIGLLGALFPAEVTSWDAQGEGRGCTAPADWHCGMLGGEGWTTPAAACTACLGAKVLDRYSFTCCL